MSIYGRTDLASEARLLRRQGVRETTELPGVRARQETLDGLSLTAVEILDAAGEQALGKPRGRYFTLELPGHFDRGAEDFPSAVTALAALLRRCALPKDGLVLIAALGNPDITPDAVGSLAAESILVTRHLKQGGNPLFARFRETVLCRTGVLGTTGMESAAQIQAICAQFHPDCVLAIDALAGVEMDKLCRSVQVCDTGIAPGSGVGNDRQALNRDSLGVPVIAIGVPTVIDASFFSQDPGLEAMFVTPRDIDSAVRAVSRLIGYGVNLALHSGLSIEDVDALVG